MTYYGSFIPQTIYNEIYSFKIQLYLFIILSVILLVFRAVRTEKGKKLSFLWVFLFPIIYLVLTAYSMLNLTLVQLYFTSVLYVVGLIMGVERGRFTKFQFKYETIYYRKPIGITTVWTILFLFKWYLNLYVTSYPPILDPILASLITLSGGLILGQAFGISIAYGRFKKKNKHSEQVP
ncbi:MAG: hypothetical protein ACYDAO_03425 [Thermoplasmataceae archaeon]